MAIPTQQLRGKEISIRKLKQSQRELKREVGNMSGEGEEGVAEFTALDLILLIFAIPSWLFYVTFLIMLIKKRDISPFNSSFFRLNLILGMVDCAEVPLVYLFCKCPCWAVFGDLYVSVTGPWLARGAEGTIHALSYVQFVMVMIMALNRCCSILYPTKVENVCMWQCVEISSIYGLGTPDNDEHLSCC